MPLTPAEQAELDALMAQFQAAQGAASAAPSSGDTLVDMARNLYRGASAGVADIANAVVPPSTFAPAMESLQAAGRAPVGFAPGGMREPPVGAGIGYRTGQSIGRTVPTLGMGGIPAQLGMALAGGAVAEGVQGVTGSPLAGDVAEFGVNIGAMAAPALTRAAFRGINAAPGTTGANVAGELADRAITGVDTGVGPATMGRTVPDTLQSFAEKVPGGRGMMQSFQQRVANSFQEAVDRFTGLTGRHAQSADALRAGTRMQRDIRAFRSTLDDRMAAIVSRINIPEASPVNLSSTQATLQAIGQRSTGIAELDALGASPAMRAAGAVAEQGLPPTSYAAAVRLRSQIGRRLRNAGLVSDITTGELKQLYGALSEDIGRTIETTGGPQARQLWDQSRRMWRREMRVFEEDLERIAEMVDPARAAQLVSRSPRTLHIIRRRVSPETYDTLVSATFNQLGEAVNRAQNASGTVFSLETFLTNWNKLGAQSREALLAGPRYAQAREGLNALARQASRAREINQRISNASGTARGLADITAAGAIPVGLAMGKVWPAVAAGLAVGGSAASAKLMTNPQFLRWMNQAIRVPPEQAAGTAVRLVGMIRDGGWTPEESEAAANIALELQRQTGRER